MGIRLVCPNGHQLHVKAELAGRRGICPHCKAPVQIPAEDVVVPTTAPAVDISGADRSILLPTVSPGSVSPPLPPAPPSPRVSSPPPPPTPPVESAEWYVRTPEGEQYGPATALIFGQWIEEGRVTDDSYVWKSGWPDWLLAGTCAGDLPRPLGAVPKLALPNLPTAAAVSTSTAKPVSAGGHSIATPAGVAEPTDPAAIAIQAASRLQRKRRQAAQRQAIIAGVLGLMALVMGVVLVVVLQRDDQPAKPPANNTATTTVAAPASTPAANSAVE